MIEKAILAEVESITGDLIEVGICIDQNFPTLTRSPSGETLVGFSKLANLAITLKNIPYAEAYQVLAETRSYNMKFLDGGLIQILYRFGDGVLAKHRLAFFPSPDLLEYQNNSDLYNQDEIYADITSRGNVTVPMRFDFDRSVFVAAHHPMSHLTIGQYKNCRIGVSGPLTPFYFMSFILKAFYNTPYRNLCATMVARVPRFGQTMVREEFEDVHVNACGSGQIL